MLQHLTWQTQFLINKILSIMPTKKSKTKSSKKKATSKKKTRKVNRSSRTGKFVTGEFTRRNPDTTETEKV